MAETPGTVALFGSGETSPSGRKVYEWIFDRLQPPIRAAVLETPAGFQPNSALVAGKVGDFLRGHLQSHRPEVALVPARRRGSPFSPDDPDLLAPLLQANVLFLGPGSPTYAVRQLRGSLAWRYVESCHRRGAALLLASAATIAAGAHALPVYEIYKAGEDPHWRPGLDLFGAYGLSLVLVPHWDNVEGGADLDTSRCFMGRDRFERLLALLPPEATVVGIDEHTALLAEPGAGICRVMGRGGVTLLREGRESRYGSGRSFSADRLGPLHPPAPLEPLPADLAPADPASAGAPAPRPEPPPEVLSLVRARDEARVLRDWPSADALRLRIAELGWRVVDTPEGPRLEPTP